MESVRIFNIFVTSFTGVTFVLRSPVLVWQYLNQQCQALWAAEDSLKPVRSAPEIRAEADTGRKAVPGCWKPVVATSA